MKYRKTIISTITVAFLATGCVKPAETQQTIYSNTQTQQPTYEEAAPIVYEDPNAVTTTSSGVDYGALPTDNTVITTNNGTYTPQPAGQPVYTNPYETGGATSYPDPYATNGGGATSYPATSYPPASSSPTSSSSAPQGGGIQLQVAALKDYYAAEEFKNTLSLAPGQSAYVQRGPMNKVIVTGISSIAEANRLKESRFPGAFIVSGGSSYGGGYTPAPTSTSSGAYGDYSVNNPYGSSSSSASVGGIGVQIGAYSTRSKAQSVADSHGGQHPAVVKKVNGLYKVILTGFSSRSSAKAYASRVGGFVVSSY